MIFMKLNYKNEISLYLYLYVYMFYEVNYLKLIFK